MLRHGFAAAAGILLWAGAALAQNEMTAIYRAEGVPLDPADAAWNAAPAVTLELEGQTVTEPMVERAAVSEVTLQAMTDGENIGFRLTWKDPSEDRFHAVGRFSDAIAVMIPYRPSDEVPITMGDKGDRVLILHWAAFRQENIDHGYADVAKLHPNYAYDWYPHAEKPYRYPEDWRNQYALAYIGGEKVYRKNTIASPVREVVAEGFGSSTWKDVQRAEGQGIYRDGSWQVVIRRRFIENNTSNPHWGPGTTTYVTVAAWDGSAGDRGARKSLHYEWVPLQIRAE
ncbi:MAG TPA: nitrate reductase [Rhodospirillales bacterium]|nr:nitrate reductase [Rhodospirillales bacterium]